MRTIRGTLSIEYHTNFRYQPSKIVLKSDSEPVFFRFLKFLKKSNFEKILGGTNFLENQKTGRESTGNFLICLQFKFYQNRLKIKKVRAGNVTGGNSTSSPLHRSTLRWSFKGGGLMLTPWYNQNSFTQLRSTGSV